MNGETVSIATLAGFIATRRTGGRKGTDASLARVPSEPPEELHAMLQTRPRLALPSVGPGDGEIWETCSYVLLWLCGWISIGLCFRCRWERQLNRQLLT